MLHVVSLPTDETAEMDDHSLCFLPLTDNALVGVLQSNEVLFVSFPFPLELFRNLLLKNQSLERIVPLLFST